MFRTVFIFERQPNQIGYTTTRFYISSFVYTRKVTKWQLINELKCIRDGQSGSIKLFAILQN